MALAVPKKNGLFGISLALTRERSPHCSRAESAGVLLGCTAGTRTVVAHVFDVCVRDPLCRSVARASACACFGFLSHASWVYNI